MYHGHPGSDYNCRCCGAPFDADIFEDNKIENEVKEGNENAEEMVFREVKNKIAKANENLNTAENAFIKALERKENAERNANKIFNEEMIKVAEIKSSRLKSLSNKKRNAVFGFQEHSASNFSELEKIAKEKNIEYVDVKKLEKKLTDKEIIKKIGGNDKTNGSCSVPLKRNLDKNGKANKVYI